MCVRAGSAWETVSEFLNPVSMNRKKLPQNPASMLLKHIGRNRPNSDYSISQFLFPGLEGKEANSHTRCGCEEEGGGGGRGR